MRVPLLDLRAQYAGIRDEIRVAIDRVLESQQFILGPEVSAFEEDVAHYTGAQHAVGVSSGTDALLIALMALGIGPGDEVITTPFSFFATAGVIARRRARIVFADIDPVSLNIDPRAMADAVTERTRAVIPVHLFGRCADLDGIMAATSGRDIAIVEDAAQALGAVDRRGRRAGTTGIAGCFSFFPSKNLGAFGDAGLVCTGDTTFADTLRTLRVHGSRPKYHHHRVGGNFRIDALQAAILRVKLRHLEGWSAARRRNADRYRRLFGETGPDDGNVRLPQDVSGHIYNQFVIRTGARDALREHLARAGIGTEVYYPVPLHLQACFRDLGHTEGDFPVAEAAAREVLALPIYPELTEEQQSYVVDTVRRFVA